MAARDPPRTAVADETAAETAMVSTVTAVATETGKSRGAGMEEVEAVVAAAAEAEAETVAAEGAGRVAERRPNAQLRTWRESETRVSP